MNYIQLLIYILLLCCHAPDYIPTFESVTDDSYVCKCKKSVHYVKNIWSLYRNTVELEIRQDATQQRGIRKYVGPLLVTIQELDGTFSHTLQVEGTVAKADITCHSKSRRNKKKKIPLCTGEEVDMDLSAMELVTNFSLFDNVL